MHYSIDYSQPLAIHFLFLQICSTSTRRSAIVSALRAHLYLDVRLSKPALHGLQAFEAAGGSPLEDVKAGF